jgi:hypothetical protein
MADSPDRKAAKSLATLRGVEAVCVGPQDVEPGLGEAAAASPSTGGGRATDRRFVFLPGLLLRAQDHLDHNARSLRLVLVNVAPPAAASAGTPSTIRVRPVHGITSGTAAGDAT